jgi:hypothetical protein
MAEKAQQQTLSVRISDALRRRLERLRQQAATKTGEPVSTSEIAKQLLESAREDRLEVVDLLAMPTDALRQIRRKAEAKLPLTRAEWTAVAYFVQQGLEAFHDSTPNRVSRESVIAILDAFLSLHALRRDTESPRDAYYLGNLPADAKSPSSRRAERDTVSADVVRRVANEARRRLEEVRDSDLPLLVGRNLSVLLEDDKLPGADAIHRTLLPYWPALWKLAARGHFVVHQKPVGEPAMHAEALHIPPIPPVTDGTFTLSVMRVQGNDLSVLISFPGALGPMYPVSLYPKLTEFLTMLTTLGPDEQRQWSGRHFFGYVSTSPEDRQSQVWFRAPENGITLGFSREQWTALRALFARAWELPDVRNAWDALALDYGEL